MQDGFLHAVDEVAQALVRVLLLAEPERLGQRCINRKGEASMWLAVLSRVRYYCLNNPDS